MEKRKVIILNWKMSPVSLKEAQKILSVLKVKNPQPKANIVICPPFVYLPILLGSSTSARRKASYDGSSIAFSVGGQNCFWENPPTGEGAFTGEISPKMLKNLGVEYVIIGHSERREHLKETDEVINKKIKTALKTGLKIILCVGENLSIKEKGIKSVKNFIRKQLLKDLKKVHDSNFIIHNSLIIAYEPIWAIGTGNYCKPKDAVEIIKYIKKFLLAKPYTLNPHVIYGGSVNSKNISDYLNEKEINGVLVGGASVNLKELKEILRTLKKC